MKRTHVFFVLILSAAVATGAFWLERADASAAVPGIAAQEPAEPQAPSAQTASGKVAAVSATSLSIETEQAGEKKTLDFVLDTDTKIEGQLQAGADVEVTYRNEEGRNIATQVRVLA